MISYSNRFSFSDVFDFVQFVEINQIIEYDHINTFSIIRRKNRLENRRKTLMNLGTL